MLVPWKFQVFPKFFEFKKNFEFCHFWLKYDYMGENKFFCEVGNFILAKIHGKQTKYKKKYFFQKLWKKPEILMVLTLQFDKNLLRYITFNLQRLSRTVLVYHFNNLRLSQTYLSTFISALSRTHNLTSMILNKSWCILQPQLGKLDLFCKNVFVKEYLPNLFC